MPAWKKTLRVLVAVLALSGAVTSACNAAGNRFTIAVIPDTQFYMDYTHQKAAGYPYDSADIFLGQMRYVASRTGPDGDIAFVTAVGDVWQHSSVLMDPAHVARGYKRAVSPVFDVHLAPTEKTRTDEMPMARKGYELIAGRVPFSVVPGNHDFDAQWIDSRYPPSETLKYGRMVVGGVTNFNAVFGADTPFFKGKDWYVDSFHGGADSAQIFTAGGYRFLHIGLEFDPSNEVLAWAASVVKRFPGLPTIVSTHNFLDTQGRRSSANDAHVVDPEANNPQMVWEKFISQHDQIFLVLCGHSHGQAFRVDDNRFGHKVYQVLSDYQGRQQVPKDAGLKETEFGGGDGWMRLMDFDMAPAVPTIAIQTYSTHYKKRSTESPEYASWYKAQEQPQLTDEAFSAADDFSVQLSDFRARFGTVKGEERPK